MRPGVEALQALTLFSACTPTVLTQLNDIADLERLGPNEVLFREGARLDELNILLSGYAITTRSQSDGEDAFTDIVEPIKPIALPVVLLGGASLIGARTVTSALVIVISARELRPLIRKVPALRSSFFDSALK